MSCGVEMPSDLDCAMNQLIRVFGRYAEKQGDRLHLNRMEMWDLFHVELQGVIQASRNPQKTLTILGERDQNRDGQVDFEEYAAMAVKLTMCSHPYFDTCRNPNKMA